MHTAKRTAPILGVPGICQNVHHDRQLLQMASRIWQYVCLNDVQNEKY
jgi:hypothetical protein